MNRDLKIGELAKKIGLSPKTIRYYEEIGLLPIPRRNESGYRLYAEEDLHRLHLIKRARLLGLTLAEIKEFVEYALDGRCSSFQNRLLMLLGRKLREIDQTIDDLLTFKNDLQRYYDTLSRKVHTTAENETRASDPTSCHCIGKLEHPPRDAD